MVPSMVGAGSSRVELLWEKILFYRSKLHSHEREVYSERLAIRTTEGTAMSNLDYLIERARQYRQTHGFSQEEQDRQVRSFAYGNTRLENDRITDG